MSNINLTTPFKVLHVEGVSDDRVRELFRSLIKILDKLQQDTGAAINSKADLLSPAFTGVPVAPTNGSPTDSSTQIATDAFVQSAIASYNANMRVTNSIINGCFRVSQYNGSNAVTITSGAALAYVIDRWWASCTGANVTGQQIAGTGDNLNIYSFSGAANVTAINFGQRISQANSYDMAGKTVTLSAYISNSLLSTVTWTLYYANTADTFGTLAAPTKTQIATGTFNVTPTLTRLSTQISIPAAASTGLELVLSVGAQISGAFNIGRVQLELSSRMSAFERRSLVWEMQNCLSYYYKISHAAAPFISAEGNATAPSNGVAYASLSLPVPMRAVPNITLPVFTTANCAAPALSSTYTDRILISALNTAAGRFYFYDSSGALIANSEL